MSKNHHNPTIRFAARTSARRTSGGSHCRVHVAPRGSQQYYIQPRDREVWRARMLEPAPRDFYTKAMWRAELAERGLGRRPHRK